jgi:type I restriction enzyme S subunit
MEKKRLVPKLRFPGFEGEWEENRLEALTIKVGSGITPKGGSSVYKHTGHPFVRSQNVGYGVLLLDDIAFIDDAVHKRQISTEIQIGDVLLNITGASIGRSAVATQWINGGNVNQHVCIIRLKESISPSFVCNFILSDDGQKQIDRLQAGGNRQGLNFEQVKSFSICMPNGDEQQKIASCLSSIDALISAHAQKLDVLKTYKKGLMQQLFPAEGKKVPRLRFPEFEGEWEETKLGIIAGIIHEKVKAKKYTLLSVTAGVGFVSQSEKFGKEIAGESCKNYYVIRKWDFAYNKSATKLYPEGYIAMLRDYEVAAVPNSIFMCFRIIDKNVLPRFVDCLFQNNQHGNWLRKFIEVGARAHGALSVSPEALLNMPISIPSIDEQQKVASCLSSIDTLISAQAQKLEALKAHKKGLMQQLFPIM